LILLSFLFSSLAHGDHGDGHTHKPEDPCPGVTDLTSSNVDDVISPEKDALVEFYAPWCGHCKSLANDYFQLGQAMESSKPKDLVVAKVDCTAQQAICQKYGVQGYPTIKFFNKGQPEEYNGGRSVDDFVEFLNKKGARLHVSKPVSHVHDLNPSNFDSILDGSKNVLIKFYAPWCGHCKSLAPKWELLGKAFSNEGEVVIAKVDADKYRSLGERFAVQGFPTLKFFPKGTKTSPQDFNRGGEQEMVDSVNKLSGTHRQLSGALNDEAGKDGELDQLAKKLCSSSSDAEKKTILGDAKKSTHKHAGHYLRVMQKVTEQGVEYAKKEYERLSRIIQGGSTSSQQLDDFTIRKNILSSFTN